MAEDVLGAAEDPVKFVYSFPVMTTLTVVPAAAAPGATTATAAAGLLVVAEPLSETVRGNPPGAEFAIVSEPLTGPEGVVLPGAKITERMQDELAAIVPVAQLVVAVKLADVAKVKVSDSDS